MNWVVRDFLRRKKFRLESDPACETRFLLSFSFRVFPRCVAVALIDIFHGNTTSRRGSWVQRGARDKLIQRNEVRIRPECGRREKGEGRGGGQQKGEKTSLILRRL